MPHTRRTQPLPSEAEAVSVCEAVLCSARQTAPRGPYQQSEQLKLGNTGDDRLTAMRIRQCTPIVGLAQLQGKTLENPAGVVEILDLELNGQNIEHSAGTFDCLPRSALWPF